MSVPSGQRIPFSCPHCGHHTEVDSQYAGHSGPCVSCNNIITIPSIESTYVASPAPSVPRNTNPAWVRGGIAIGGVLCLGVLSVVVWSLLRPAFSAAREAAECSQCESNLIAISAALDSYYAKHGEYPPAVMYDENGQAMHSWRALLLPHLGPEGINLASQYNMDEPWDSNHNSNFVSRMPAVYACPSDGKSLQGETSYLAIVGDNTVINRDRPTRRSADYDGPVLRDNPSETMVIIEASG